MLLSGCGSELAQRSASAPAPQSATIENVPATSGTTGDDTVATATAAAQRMISYRAEMHLAVEHFDDIPAQVDALAARYGGFVAEANQSGKARYRRNGNWTLRVPANRY